MSNENNRFDPPNIPMDLSYGSADDEFGKGLHDGALYGAHGEPNWDLMYRIGRPPWDTGIPAPPLLRFLDANPPTRENYPSCTSDLDKITALDLGSGTGANAIELHRRGFDITAIEHSPMAMERAYQRAEEMEAVLRFVLADVFEFGKREEKFDLILDAGVYHYIRKARLEEYLQLLRRISKPGTLFFCLAGREDDKNPPSPTFSPEVKEPYQGPPTVSEDHFYDELGRLFDLEELEPITLGSPKVSEGFPGWACLMRFPQID